MMAGNKKIDLPLFLDTMPMGICLIDAAFQIAIWNRTLITWTGISSERAVSNYLGDVVPDLFTPLIRERIQVAFSGGGPVILSSRFHPNLFPHASGDMNEGKYQRTTIIPFYTRNCESGAMLVVEDVTAISEQVFIYREIKEQVQSELEERKKTERALAIANNKLNTLAAVTRHDLQNLLTAFNGYLTLSLDEKPEGRIKAYLEKMKSLSETMKKQLAFTRDYQDMGIRTPGWFRIHDLIQSAAQGPFFTKVTIDIQTGSLSILGDPLIEKAIYNLMENAVRHGKRTSTITVKSEKSGDDVDIIVSDDGVGIPDKVKPRIFERGFGSNTGLGLFLTQEILSITGLEISEDGVEGQGARFVIRVPKGQFRFDDNNQEHRENLRT